MLQPVHALTFAVVASAGIPCRWRRSPNRMAAAPGQLSSPRARMRLWLHHMARYVLATVLLCEVGGMAWLARYCLSPVCNLPRLRLVRVLDRV